jgi:peptidoglycan-associated lipoprotein
VVEGVSLVENYRAQFNRILQERSHAALVELMRDKIATRRLSPAPLTATAGASALRDTLFEPNDSSVRASARRILDENAARLKARDDVRVVIEGHADSRGTPALNRRLAMARARAVRDYLVARGIDAGRLTTVSRGSEDSLCAEPREECWAKNRRVRLRTAE